MAAEGAEGVGAGGAGGGAAAVAAGPAVTNSHGSPVRSILKKRARPSPPHAPGSSAAASSAPPGKGEAASVAGEEEPPRKRTRRGVSWAPDSDLCRVTFIPSRASMKEAGGGSQAAPGSSSRDEMRMDYFSKRTMSAIIAWGVPPRLVLPEPIAAAQFGVDSVERGVQRAREADALLATYPRMSMVPPNPTEAVGADAAGEARQPPAVPFHKPGSEPPPVATSAAPGAGGLEALLQGLNDAVGPAAAGAHPQQQQQQPPAGDLLSALSTDPSILSSLLGSVSPTDAAAAAQPPPPPPPPPPHPQQQYQPQQPYRQPYRQPTPPPRKPRFDWGPPAAPYGGLVTPQHAPPQQQQPQQPLQQRGKPCVFFNTRDGCRNGPRCKFVHDPTYRATEFPGDKGRGRRW